MDWAMDVTVTVGGGGTLDVPVGTIVNVGSGVGVVGTGEEVSVEPGTEIG